MYTSAYARKRYYVRKGYVRKSYYVRRGYARKGLRSQEVICTKVLTLARGTMYVRATCARAYARKDMLVRSHARKGTLVRGTMLTRDYARKGTLVRVRSYDLTLARVRS